MGIKRHKPEEIVTKLRQVEVLCSQGIARVDAIRQVQITEQTFYRWRKQYGGMGTDQLKELERLKKENERLRRAASDLRLDKLILSEAARGNYCALRAPVPALSMCEASPVSQSAGLAECCISTAQHSVKLQKIAPMRIAWLPT
jgi:putative transposase